MQRRTMISGVVAGFVGASTLSGCSADPVKEAQARADRAVPGHLQVAEAHREKFQLFHGSLYATYRSIADPDCGFTIGKFGFGAKTIQKEYKFAVWRTRELRRIQGALATVDRTPVAVDIDPGGNYLVGVGNWNVTVTVWLQSPLAKNLVAECARLDQAAAVWHGPDLQIPTGSEQVGKSPDRTDTFLSSFLRFELLPADSRGRLPTPAAKLPLLVQLSAPDRIDAAKAAARQETSTFLQEDGSFLPVGYQLKPAWPRVDLNLLSDRANAVARSFLARRHPSLSGGGMVDYRYDGRLDRLRAYVNIETKIPGKVAPPSTTGVGMTLDLDYRNPTEVKLVKISDDGSRTWEPGRLRR